MSQSYVSGGARLRYTEAGSGIPVVFLHPTPLDHEYWRPLVAELDGIRAIVPDLRGHGQSELGTNLPVGLFTRVPDAPVLTIQQLAADVRVLLEVLGIPQAVFVGCSIGGYVMLELWRQAPKQMRGLAFVCSKPQPDTAAGQAKRAENIAHIRAEGTEGFFNSMAQTLVGATTRAQRPMVEAEVRARMTLTADTVVAVQAALATRLDSIATVRTIDVPVLAIAGGEDPVVSPVEMQVFREAPGGCESHVIADAGHFAAYEQPSAVGALMEPWLAQFKA